MTAKRGGPGRGSAARRSRQHKVSAAQRNGLWPWLFVLPLLSGVLVFYLWPIVQNFLMSFSRVSPFGHSSKFVGLDNYQTLLESGELAGAFGNTLIYTGIVLLGIPIAVFLAALISRPGLKGANVYRTIYFMPYVAMPAAISIVWKMIYNGDFGILNHVLRTLGVENPPYWLSTPGVALVAVAILGLWASIGFNMIILSAGLKSIPLELYEAASLDGASHMRQFFSITVPLLTPSIFFLTVMQAISGFQLFDTLFVLISPVSPAMPHTRSMVYLFYEQAFINNDKGYGAAIAVVILLFVALVTAIQFRFQKKWVTYV
ncbi:MAG: sugar ABC transporter permease [Bowdeniella nasicola]|nr:sugar ABC transporter permease [Bowdeniella nasicola]